MISRDRLTSSMRPLLAPVTRGSLVLLLAATALLTIQVMPAAAATPGPGWALDSFAQPTNFAPGDSSGKDTYVVTATNAGSVGTNGAATLSDDVPAGLTVQSVDFFLSWLGPNSDQKSLCTFTSAHAQCTLSGFVLLLHPSVAPDEWLQMVVHVAVDPDASGPLTNQASVSGGGAPTVSASERNEASSTPAAFGVAHFSTRFAGVDGRPDTQAGAHPYELTTRIDLTNKVRLGPQNAPLEDTTVEDLKDVIVDLPLGFMGSALAAPTCTFAQLNSQVSGGVGGCPANTVVGHIRTEPQPSSSGVDGPIYNMVPEHGVAAEFGYVDALANSHVLYASVAPTPAGYVLRTTSPDVPQILLRDVVVTFYGNPAARDATGNVEVPMFTNPADCSAGALTTAIHADSWAHPGGVNADGSPDFSDPNWVSATSTSPPVQGCNKLQFHLAFSLRPTTNVADSPSGLDVGIEIPQSEDPDTLATPPLKDASVTLPPGFAVNPSSADGLGACSPQQIALGSPAPPTCPESSKIGTVELQTPLLPGTLGGSIYLATQNDNPFHALLAGYIVVDDPTTGVVIKIPGNLTPDPRSGQITGAFADNPQFPFSDLRLHFKGGGRGVLATPPTCGTYTTATEFVPWTSPQGSPVSPTSSAAISSAPGGGPCAGSEAQMPNAPGFEAGTASPLAGAYSPFVLKLTREDGSQRLRVLNVSLPPGLTGRLRGIPYCSEAQVAQARSRSHPGEGRAELASPSCPVASQVGTVTVGSGAGPQPFHVQGKAYLAGPYKGAPLSLAIVTPAVAGPFDLGVVTVRTALHVNERTAQITAESDPLPTILQGIPLDVRSIALRMDRSNFTLNPTSCEAMSIAGQAISTTGNAAPLHNRFQVGSCGALKFKPHLKLRLKGATRRSGHPALKAVVTYPKKGRYANIARAQVGLPHSEFLDQGNLDKVCKQADLHAGTCPKRSVYGHAKAWTPLLDKPLRGPVYLGVGFGYKLPALVADLNGQIRILLVGKVDTTKHKGIRNTFEVVPDAPVSRFVLTMKGGKRYGLLENSENLCAKTQRASALFNAQNGLRLHMRPKIHNGCKHKHRKPHRAHARAAGRR